MHRTIFHQAADIFKFNGKLANKLKNSFESI